MTLALRLAIIDDEPLAISRIRRMLAAIEDIEVVGSTSNSGDALRLVEEAQPDVVLLDVQMPAPNGIELARRFALESLPVVIFVTAFGRFAVEAFEAAAVDYLVKPVLPARLMEALSRARATVESRQDKWRLAELGDLLKTFQNQDLSRTEQSVWVRDRGNRVRVPVQQIYLVRAESYYVKVFTRERTYLHRASLQSMQVLLESENFIQVHRGAIVRRGNVVRITKDHRGASIVVLDTGDEVKVSRRHVGKLRTDLEWRAAAARRGAKPEV